MQTNRFWPIDFMRGLSILLVILIHCTFYFIGKSPVAYFFWNYSQFCVPAFIFCSAYIYFQSDSLFNIPSPSGGRAGMRVYLNYIKKRFFRLLKPYYLFLLFFFSLLWFTNPLLLNTKYIIQSILTTGGVDISWLVLLFLQLTLILPLISFLLPKYKLLAGIFFLIAFSSTFNFALITFNSSIKLASWLPWSLVLFFTYFFTRYKSNKTYLKILFACLLIIFVFSFQFLVASNSDLVLRNNKYPPNLYFLSYGMIWILILYFLAPFLRILTKPLTFLSTYSYQIFFIHYFFLIWLASYKPLLTLPWWVFFLLVFGVTLITLVIVNLSFRPRAAPMAIGASTLEGKPESI